ncbi:MAG: PadR family transcriptional regulator [Candidatus Hermodarchaeia archaeon]
MRSLELKRAILRLFRGAEFYGYEIQKQLASAGHKIELTRLYRVLNEMLTEKLLTARWEKSSKGPRKRMYSVGKRGETELEQILKEAIDTVHEFYSEYLRKIAPQVLNDLVQFMTNGLSDEVRIVYVVSEPTVMHKHLLKSLQHRLPESVIYFVKPETMSFDEKFSNLSLLNGSFQMIPLKQEFADLLVVPNLSRVHNLNGAVQEWHRLLNNEGKLVIGFPSVLIHQYKDPLTIGQYMEKIEHQSTNIKEQFDKELLENTLKHYFRKIEHTHVVHLTVYSITEKRSL